MADVGCCRPNDTDSGEDGNAGANSGDFSDEAEGRRGSRVGTGTGGGGGVGNEMDRRYDSRPYCFFTALKSAAALVNCQKWDRG